MYAGAQAPIKAHRLGIAPLSGKTEGQCRLDFRTEVSDGNGSGRLDGTDPTLVKLIPNDNGQKANESFDPMTMVRSYQSRTHGLTNNWVWSKRDDRFGTGQICTNVLTTGQNARQAHRRVVAGPWRRRRRSPAPTGPPAPAGPS